MITVRALKDGEEQGLEPLGEMHAIKGAPAEELRFQKRVTIPGAGSYWKEFFAPLYSSSVMEELSRREGGCGPCLGVLAKKGSSPKGFIRRQLGLHSLSVPVYDQAGRSPLGWKVMGYLPAGEGYVRVVKRRVAYWVGLGITALAVFSLSYLLFRFGPQTLWNTLLELPEVISDNWYRMLHEWGVL